MSADIAKKFCYITGLKLRNRQVNRIIDSVERKDTLFPQLANLFYRDRAAFTRLLQEIGSWVSEDSSETVLALGGYVYYIAGDYKRARDLFLRVISVSPEDTDTWFDLAFTLRHLGELEESNTILFNQSFVQYYYIRFGLSGQSYQKLKQLFSMIWEKTQGTA